MEGQTGYAGRRFNPQQTVNWLYFFTYLAGLERKQSIIAANRLMLDEPQMRFETLFYLLSCQHDKLILAITGPPITS